MGYAVDVKPVTVFKASCAELGCDWLGGPYRANEEDAEEDADGHRAEHVRRRLAYDEAIERGCNSVEARKVLDGKAQPPLRIGDRARNADGEEGTLAWNDGALWGLDQGEPWGVHEVIHGVEDWGPGLTWLPPAGSEASSVITSGDMAVELPIEPDKVVDLMEALEKAIAAAKEANRRG